MRMPWGSSRPSVLLAVGLAASALSRGRRTAAAATVPMLGAALALAQSTASDVALGVGLVVTVLLTPSLLRTLCGGLLVAPGAAIAFGLATYSHLAVNVPTTRISGHTLAAAVLGCVVLAAVPVAFVGLPTARPRPPHPQGSSSRSSSRWAARRPCTRRLHGTAGVGAASPGNAGARAPAPRHGRRNLRSLLGAIRQPDPVRRCARRPLALSRRSRARPARATPLAAFLLACSPRHSPPRCATALRARTRVPRPRGARLGLGSARGRRHRALLRRRVATADLQPSRALGAATRYALLAVTFVFGACAIAGARSSTVPAAVPAPETAKAPPSGAFAQTRA